MPSHCKTHSSVHHPNPPYIKDASLPDNNASDYHHHLLESKDYNKYIYKKCHFEKPYKTYHCSDQWYTRNLHARNQRKNQNAHRRNSGRSHTHLHRALDGDLGNWNKHENGVPATLGTAARRRPRHHDSFFPSLSVRRKRRKLHSTQARSRSHSPTHIIDCLPWHRSYQSTPMRFTDDHLTGRAPNPRTGALSASSTVRGFVSPGGMRGRCIGTGAIRAASTSSLFSNRSDSTPPKSMSPAEPLGFGESPYGAGSRAMRDVTTMALGTASVGRKTGLRVKKTDAMTIPAQATTESRPCTAERQGSDTELGSKWRVDGRGWMVDVKQASSPKLFKTTGPFANGSGTGLGMSARAASTNNLPRRANWPERMDSDSYGTDWAKYESPQLGIGRVLGAKPRENIPLADVKAVPGVQDCERPEALPVRNPSVAQVEAYKHYERKSRRLSAQEYAAGFTPPSAEFGDIVADAGMEAKRSRQQRQFSKLYDEIFEAYSSTRGTGCGAEGDCEDASQRNDGLEADHGEGLLPHQEPRVVELDSTPPDTPPSKPPTHFSSVQEGARSSPARRPGLVIYRKPVGSSSSIPLASKLTASTLPIPVTSSSASHARSSSSPSTINDTNEHTTTLVSQLRATSSSPPKKKQGLQFALRRPHIDASARGMSLPCAFPAAVTLEPDVDEPWPPTPTPASASARLKGRSVLGRWKIVDLGAIPTSIHSSNTHNERDGDVDEASHGQREDVKHVDEELRTFGPVVLWDLHPYLKFLVAEVLTHKSWIIWAGKTALMLYIAACLWSVLDAARGAMVTVLWPVIVAWEFGKWIVGN